MDKLLYFPSISIPKSKWLMGALFYWDKVGAIVPLEFLGNPNKLDPHMQKLVHTGLVEQVIPESYIYDIPDFHKGFYNFIEADEATNYMTKLGNLKFIGKHIKTSKIHMGKLGDIGEELVRRNLATKSSGNWYFVESYTAQNFMAYLATVLGSITEYQPITDSYKGLSNLIQNNNMNSEKHVKENLRNSIIEKILPIPLSIDDPYDIYRFKEKYHCELKRFRNYIEKFLLDLEMFPKDQIERRIKMFTEESLEEIQFLSGKMRSFKWDLLSMATLCAIFPPSIDLLTGANNNNAFEIATGTTGLLGAVYTALGRNNKAELNRKPLAYAALMGRGFKYDITSKPPATIEWE